MSSKLKVKSSHMSLTYNHYFRWMVYVLDVSSVFLFICYIMLSTAIIIINNNITPYTLSSFRILKNIFKTNLFSFFCSIMQICVFLNVYFTFTFLLYFYYICLVGFGYRGYMNWRNIGYCREVNTYSTQLIHNEQICIEPNAEVVIFLLNKKTIATPHVTWM